MTDEEDTRTTREARGEILIDAAPERVWRALTEAEELVRWFPLTAEVQPGEGGTVRMGWDNEFEGDAEILVWDPPRHLRTEWAWGGQVTDYYVEAEGAGTRLRVVTSGFPEGAEWDDWLEGTVRGWIFELGSLKEYLERHAGEGREVVYLRRLVEDSPESVWDRLEPEGMTDPSWDGEPIDRSPPSQIAGRVREPVEGLYRLTAQPAHRRPGVVDVTLWFQAWDTSPGALDEGRETWTRTLERVFPDGEAP